MRRLIINRLKSIYNFQNLKYLGYVEDTLDFEQYILFQANLSKSRPNPLKVRES